MQAGERNLDLLLVAHPAGARIELDGGHYVTAGREISTRGDTLGFVTRPGWKVFGKGSTIRMEPQRRPGGAKADTLYGVFLSRFGENVGDFSIRDVTFDMGYGPTDRHACSAVGLVGEDMEVLNCRAVHWGNGSAKAETFLFSLGAPHQQGPSLARRNVIRNCQCVQPAGPFSKLNVTCFMIGGGIDMDSVGFLAMLDNKIDFGGANNTPEIIVRNCHIVTGRNQNYYDADRRRQLTF